MPTAKPQKFTPILPPRDLTRFILSHAEALKPQWINKIYFKNKYRSKNIIFTFEELKYLKSKLKKNTSLMNNSKISLSHCSTVDKDLCRVTPKADIHAMRVLSCCA